MSLTLNGWLLGLAVITLAALLISRTRTWLLQLARGANASKWAMPAVAFISVAGIGAAAPYFREPPWAAKSEGMQSASTSHHGVEDAALAELKDYARSSGLPKTPVAAAAEKPLPDVNTMIERLAARLRSNPEDIQGWRTLGWAYYHMGRFDEAASAYAKALEIDPDSTELKLALDESKSKAAESTSLNASLSSDTASSETALHETEPRQAVKSGAMPEQDRDAAIRSMVDGLATRLETSPRDVDGWTRLMRSRVVLGEKVVAAAVFRKALDVFKDDSVASSMIAAAATELGLRAD